MVRASAWLRVGMALACVGVAWVMPGCRTEERVPTATELGGNVGGDVGAGVEVGEGGAREEAPAVARGTRYGGGFLPPIRRADLVLSVEVPVGEQFVLGGDASASYFIEVENLGTATLGIMGRRGPQRIAIGRAESGDRVAHRFAATDFVVVTNRSATDEARVKVRVWGDIGGNVRYERADVVGGPE